MRSLSSWDEEFDVVCVGSGIGGSAAALAAAEAGLAAVVLDAADVVGGTTTWSYGIVWVGANHLEVEAGIDDSLEDTLRYLTYLGGGRNDPAHTRAFTENAPRALRFFARVGGIPFRIVMGLPDHYHPLGPGSKDRGRSLQVEPFPAQVLGPWRERLDFTPYGHGRATLDEMAAWGGRAAYRNWDRETMQRREREDVRAAGAALAGHFLKAVLDHGVPVRPATVAERLVVEDGRVVGLEARCQGSPVRLRARRGVLLATGVYDANPRLMGWFDEFNSWPPHGAPRNQGGGLVMALEQGAAFTVMHWNLSVKLGYHVPGEEVAGQPLTRGAGSREVAYPHSILVNPAGERFADESAFGDVCAQLRRFDAFRHRLVNVPVHLVFDAQYWDKYGLPPLPPGSPHPDWLPSASTLPALGEKLGVDGAALERSVARFNAAVAAGRDDDFHRGRMPWSNRASGDSSLANPNLGAITQPPFFGLRMLPIEGNSVGLVTDDTAQVLHLRGHPIPGLYACGEVAALQQHVGVGYQAGTSLAGGMTFGWLAAQAMAGKALT